MRECGNTKRAIKEKRSIKKKTKPIVVSKKQNSGQSAELFVALVIIQYSWLDFDLQAAAKLQLPMF